MFNPDVPGYRPKESEMFPNREKEKEADFIMHAKSIASEKHPDRNEDTILELPERRALGVFDGMGGHAAGEVASRIARDSVAGALRKLPDNLTFEETYDAVKKALEEANEAILRESRQNPEYEDMGTTASVVKTWEGKNGERKAIIGNVGDSRVYIHRTDGSFAQVTLDDGAVRELAKDDEQKAREIQTKLNNVVDLESLTDLEQLCFAQRNQLSQALGMPRIEVRMHVIDIQAGDRILVTSDGIHDNVTDREIALTMTWEQDDQKVAETLIRGALQRSKEKGTNPRAKPDDMSLIIAEFQDAKAA